MGTALNAVFLTGFAFFTDVPVVSLAFMFGVGLVGVTMNPVMAVRAQRAGSTAPLANTVHSSFITLGSAIGSALIPAYGLRSPVILGIGMVILVIVPALGSPYLRHGVCEADTRITEVDA